MFLCPGWYRPGPAASSSACGVGVPTSNARPECVVLDGPGSRPSHCPARLGLRGGTGMASWGWPLSGHTPFTQVGPRDSGRAWCLLSPGPLASCASSFCPGLSTHRCPAQPPPPGSLHPQTGPGSSAGHAEALSWARPSPRSHPGIKEVGRGMVRPGKAKGGACIRTILGHEGVGRRKGRAENRLLGGTVLLGQKRTHGPLGQIR